MRDSGSSAGVFVYNAISGNQTRYNTSDYFKVSLEIVFMTFVDCLAEFLGQDIKFRFQIFFPMFFLWKYRKAIESYRKNSPKDIICCL